MSKKEKDALRRKKEKDRLNENSKKNIYHKIHEDKKMGNKELENYAVMYNSLQKEERLKFKSPDQKPNLDDYNLIKKYYYGNSLDKRVY